MILTGFLTAQTFMKTMAIETCDCMSTKNTDGLQQKEIEMQMGLCILESVGKNRAAFDAHFGGKSITEIDQFKFGEDIGIEMASLCPMLLLNVADLSEEAIETNLGVELGKIVSIDKKQFNVVNLETGDGSVLKFLWLWDFDGSPILVDKQYSGKWVNIFYSNVELLDAQKESYVVFKVIEGIELGE